MGRQHAHTLLTGEQQAVVMEDFQIRKLTPLECWRLQAFPDEAFWLQNLVVGRLRKRFLLINWIITIVTINRLCLIVSYTNKREIR